MCSTNLPHFHSLDPSLDIIDECRYFRNLFPAYVLFVPSLGPFLGHLNTCVLHGQKESLQGHMNDHGKLTQAIYLSSSLQNPSQ